MQIDLFPELNDEIEKGKDFKACAKCGQVKPLESYRLYRRATGDKNSRDSKCKSCSKHSNKVIAKLRQTAPPQKGVCECCGKSSDKLVLDHCHEREIFRGWLCPPCNLGIGVLGDTLEGIENAKAYLIKTKKGELK